MKKFVIAALIAAGLTGCETLPYQLTTPADRASMSQDQLIAQENQRRLAGRLETIEMELGRISRDLDTLKGQLASRCAAIEQKSEADKREMVARISSELDKLIKQTSAAAKSAAPASRGIEHTVQPGETLFIISKAYNVSAKTIMDANKIQDAGRLSVGQKLFIPQ